MFSLVVALGVFFTSGAAVRAAPAPTQGPDTPQRISFQISTGSTSGTYFPVGEVLAQLLSHPPGVARCEAVYLCGPAGLVMSTRASEGSVANVLAVNTGMVSSGLAQSDVVALAVAGEGPFRKAGPATSLRVIANLYGEDVHLLAGKNANIKSVADLRGKRVGLSTEGSGTIVTARAVLAAYRVPEKSITANHDGAERALALMQQGKLDAMFFVGGTPVSLLSQVLEENTAVLVPIDGAGRKRLLAKEPYLNAHAIAQGTYGGTPAVDTVSVDALWITAATEPDAEIYGITKALYNPANGAALNVGRSGIHFMELSSAIKDATAPLHAGAERFYAESGVLKAAQTPVPQPAPEPRKS
jgi:hypothetical protein